MTTARALRLRPLRGLWVGLLVWGLSAAPASAELVILADGASFKVTAFELSLDGEKVALDLFEGGRLVLPLERVERIVDDEWIPPDPPPPASPETMGPPPPLPELTRNWRFPEEAAVPPVPYGEAIFAAAKKHQVHPELVAAVVKVESAFRERAVSPKGARGLMQIMPATGRRFGLTTRQLFDPEKNLDAGARYLDWLLDRFDGDLVKTVAAYNAGEGAVERHGGVPPYRETREYVRRIQAVLALPAALVGGG